MLSTSWSHARSFGRHSKALSWPRHRRGMTMPPFFISLVYHTSRPGELRQKINRIVYTMCWPYTGDVAGRVAAIAVGSGRGPSHTCPSAVSRAGHLGRAPSRAAAPAGMWVRGARAAPLPPPKLRHGAANKGADDGQRRRTLRLPLRRLLPDPSQLTHHVLGDQ